MRGRAGCWEGRGGGETALKRRGITRTPEVGVQKRDVFLLETRGPISAICSVFSEADCWHGVLS